VFIEFACKIIYYFILETTQEFRSMSVKKQDVLPIIYAVQGQCELWQSLAS
jgi:hypothetical protein